ncbi:MAG: pseudouridine synthase [Armatimonadota bacterium]
MASRRDAEQLITTGKVTVNGKVVRELGQKVNPEQDDIVVDGRRVPKAVPRLYVLLYKPTGYVTTREDRHATQTVMDLVRPSLEARLGKGDPSLEGLHPVGRLDTQTEGLLILTNDGAFTHAVTHPRHRVPKLYVAEVRGIPDQEALAKLREGIPLFGRRTAPARVRVVRADRGRNVAKVEIELREGRNQQVRRMLHVVGHPVTRLTRISIGPVRGGRLKVGQWRFLLPQEVEALMEVATSPEPEEAAAPRRPVHSRREEERLGRAADLKLRSPREDDPRGRGRRGGGPRAGGGRGSAAGGRPTGPRPGGSRGGGSQGGTWGGGTRGGGSQGGSWGGGSQDGNRDGTRGGGSQDQNRGGSWGGGSQGGSRGGAQGGAWGAGGRQGGNRGGNQGGSWGQGSQGDNRGRGSQGDYRGGGSQGDYRGGGSQGDYRGGGGQGGGRGGSGQGGGRGGTQGGTRGGGAGGPRGRGAMGGQRRRTNG